MRILKNKKTVILASSISALMIVATLGLIKIKFSSQKHQMPPNPYVSISKVKTTDWQASIKSTGNLTASETAVIKTEIAGQVNAVDFTPGKNVKQGQLLVELENSQQRGEAIAAKAQLDSDQAIFKRYQKLIKSKAISQSDYDAAQYNYQISLGKLKQAQSNFDKTQIKAPFSGKIGLTSIAKGQYLAVGDTIANLVDIDRLYVDFEVPEKYSSQLAIGDKVVITSDAHINTAFEGKINALDSTISPDTASLTVRADIPNKTRQLLPGSTINIVVYFGKSQTVATIPQTALNYSLDLIYVYRWVDNKAVRTTVEVGGQQGQSIIITKGLSANDIVISAGSSKVHDGQPVNVTNTP